MINVMRKTVEWPDDSTVIDLDQPDDLRFWAERLRVSTGMLRFAAQHSGPRFRDIVFYLESRRT